MRWRAFEAWVGTRSSAVAIVLVSLAVFAVQSAVLPAFPGRDMARYVQAYVQLSASDVVLPSVLNTRGPLAALGVGAPLELGGLAAEAWLALLYAASILAWGYVALLFGPRAALLTTGLLLVYPGYGILFHGLASDSLFAASFAGFAALLSRALLRYTGSAWALAGLGMGLLALVRPANQVLIVLALLPLLVRAPWGSRLRWAAWFFVASTAMTQGWRALAELRWGDATGLAPSTGALAVAAVLLAALLVPAGWRARAALVAVPLVAVAALVAAIQVEVKSPVEYARTLAQVPGGNPFLFRAFQIEPIMSEDNGPASRELARVVERELLTREPYRSYGIDVDEFFSSGSDRMFEDLASLGGSADLGAATNEAIRQHPWEFTAGIARTAWQMLWTRRVYGPEPGAGGEAAPGAGSAAESEPDDVEIGGRVLPAPSEGQPIPSSRVGPSIRTLWGRVRLVWRSATEQALVFDDPRDERRWANLDTDTNRLAGRLPARSSSQELVHRFNQASHRFPPPAFWLAVGLVGLVVRRPQRALVALAPTFAALVVIGATSLIAYAVGEYVAPVSAAFVLLAAVGLVGASPARPLRRRSKGDSPDVDEAGSGPDGTAHALASRDGRASTPAHS